jgi:hypothetical protein
MDGVVRLRHKVLMFDDDDVELTEELVARTNEEYQKWEIAMEANPTTNLVILEIGCGPFVPSVRLEGEEVLRDFNAAEHRREKAILVRINPGEKHTQVDPNVLILNHGGALQVLKELDAFINEI